MSPLDESAGEGYHRGVSHEHTRAPSSSDMHLKQKVREKDAIRRVRAFRSKFGQRGMSVIRFEWTRYKRVLQGDWRRRWQPPRLGVRAFFRRFYRGDEKAQEDWKWVVTKQPAQNPVVPVMASNQEALQNEYTSALLHAGALQHRGSRRSGGRCRRRRWWRRGQWAPAPTAVLSDSQCCSRLEEGPSDAHSGERVRSCIGGTAGLTGDSRKKHMRWRMRWRTVTPTRCMSRRIRWRCG